ncbi:MAG: redoxin family protein, partial [Spongiibacteraceae bacterium]|nr:redoxin family protein [Spongiibacteraceae bacterium]
GKSQNAEELTLVADGNGQLTKALGLELDAEGYGMGMRSKRYAMILEDGVVNYLGIDDKEIKASAAETVLEKL